MAAVSNRFGWRGWSLKLSAAIGAGDGLGMGRGRSGLALAAKGSGSCAPRDIEAVSTGGTTVAPSKGSPARISPTAGSATRDRGGRSRRQRGFYPDATPPVLGLAWPDGMLHHRGGRAETGASGRAHRFAGFPAVAPALAQHSPNIPHQSCQQVHHLPLPAQDGKLEHQEDDRAADDQ